MEIAVADEQKVRQLMDYLVKAFEDYCNSQAEEVEYLDAFMAVHNFHVVIILDIERRRNMNHQDKLWFRKMAIDTLAQSLERRP